MRLFLLFLLCGLLQTTQNHATAQADPEPFTHTLNFESSNPDHPYLWNTSAWEECLGICDTATQSRQVHCVGGGQITSDESKCAAHPKPSATRACRGPCEVETCAPEPTCSAGMIPFNTGEDENGCDTFLCAYETCALQPNCASRSEPATYAGMDGGGCPSWICPAATCSVNPPDLNRGRCPNGSRPGWYGNRAANGCMQLRCLNAPNPTCYEGPSTCPSGNGYALQISGTNPSTGCRIRACLPISSYGSGNTPPTSTPSCPEAPNCRSGETLETRGTNSQGCTIYRCTGVTNPN